MIIPVHNNPLQQTAISHLTPIRFVLCSRQHSLFLFTYCVNHLILCTITTYSDKQFFILF
ncbi:hypothetical protein Hanom_Chr03g00274881 [Helianthus anomalus]